MTFYNIGHTNNISIIGGYPQTERTKRLGYHVEDFNSERKVNANILPDFEPNFGLDLNEKSNETDIIDRGTLEFGLVVSAKLKSILSRYNLPPHKFYPIDVYNAKNKYYWFHYITDFESFFDLKKSEIEIFDIFKQEVVDIVKFNSFKELTNYNRQLVLKIGKTMRYKSIKLNSNFPKFDLFEIKGAKHFTLITKTLKDELEAQKITGLEYLEYNKIETTPTVV